MTGYRLGRVVHAVRVRRRWRQLDLAAAAGVHRSIVSRIERGLFGGITFDTLQRVALELDITLDLLPRWHDASLDSLLNAGHSAMHESVARFFRRRPDWIV